MKDQQALPEVEYVDSNGAEEFWRDLDDGEESAVARKEISEEFGKITFTVGPVTEQSKVTSPRQPLPPGIDARFLEKPAVTPPLDAYSILRLFLDPSNADAILGDMIERYAAKLKGYGANEAKRWFITQVFITVVSLTWASTKRWLTLAFLKGVNRLPKS